MAKRSAIDELDDAVDALMTEVHAPSPRVNPRLAALLRIAADLRDLPSEAFRARLRAELRSEVREGCAPPSAGRPLVTEEDIRARLEELGTWSGRVRPGRCSPRHLGKAPITRTRRSRGARVVAGQAAPRRRP